MKFLVFLAGALLVSCSAKDLFEQLDALLNDAAEFSCDGKSDGNYVDPANCHRFYSCSGGHKTSQTCPSGLVYRPPPINECDYGSCSSAGDFCTGKANGNYKDPDNCHRFITCSNGFKYKFNCPANLVYDPKTDRCDNIPCKSRDEGFFTDNDASNFCAGKKDANYPDPENCEGYIGCVGGLTYRMPCPHGLRYNTVEKFCDWPKNVECGPRPSDVPYPPQPTTKPPVTPRRTTNAPTGYCADKDNGDYPDPENCNGFITCSNHISYKMKCPGELRYDVEKKRCEWPADVDCGSRPTAVPFVTPTPPEPTTLPSGSSEFCKTNGNGVFRDAHNCLGYIVCRNGFISYRNCRSGRRFNWQKKRCDLPRYVKCGGAGGPRGGTFCHGKKDGDYTDVVNCNGFIKCSNYFTYYFDCPSNLWFNAKKDQCDWQYNVRCPYVTPNPPEPNKPSGNSAFCKENGDGVHRDAHNCLGYVVCRNGDISYKNCHTGLRFNDFTKRCDLPRNVKCKGAGGPWGGTFCRGKKDGDYTDAVNCNGFIKCSNELTYYFDCPANLRFNLKKDQCDWPSNVYCPY